MDRVNLTAILKVVKAFGRTLFRKKRGFPDVGVMIVIAVLILSASSAESATYNLPDCSQTTVQSYITNKANDGDVLICPAGSWTWTTTTSNTPSVLITKAITLVGAGFDLNTGATTSRTTIVDDTKTADNGNEVAIKVVGVAGKMTRITGFYFTGPGDDKGVITVNGPAFWKLFRLDHCYADINGTFIGFNNTYGVIDHSTVIEEGSAPLSIRSHGTGEYTADNSSSSYLQPDPAGTTDAVYVEDCTFTGIGPTYGAGASDCDSGGQMVFRHDTFTNTGLQTHDTAYTGLRGCRYYEIYDNTFTSNAGNIAWAANIRAGSGVIYNNVVSGNYSHCFHLTNYRSSDAAHGSQNHWGYCQGVTGAESSCDGNKDQYGYPCMDQIGRIFDTNSNGPLCYKMSGSAGPAQPLDPLYAWNNKCLSSSYNPAIYIDNNACTYSCSGILTDRCDTPGVQSECPTGETCTTNNKICDSDVIKLNRDYYDNTIAKPGYEPLQYPHPLTFVPENVKANAE